jgi:hypothetical protein
MHSERCLFSKPTMSVYPPHILSPSHTQAKLDTLGPRKARVTFDHGVDTTRKDLFVNYRRTQFGAEPWRPANYQTGAWGGVHRVCRHGGGQ